MSDASYFLLAHCSFWNLQIVYQFVGVGKVFDGCFDVVAKFLVELNIANADDFRSLISVYHVILCDSLQHSHVSGDKVVD
jgi:hypothetical protein